MQPYIVFYIAQDMREDEIPRSFRCLADDHEHARKQCQDAYPDAVIHSSAIV